MSVDTPQSPQHVKMSRASAIKTGLIPGKLYRDAPLYCANLLLTYEVPRSASGCLANCSYCGLARDRGDRTEDSFIRVGWPTVELAEVKERIRGHDEIERVCVSMVVHPEATEDTRRIVESLNDLDVGISLLSCPKVMDKSDYQAIADAGADMCDIAVDAATQAVFKAHRGTGVDGGLSWENYWEALSIVGDVFGPGQFGAHFIAGLGETEAEFVESVQRVHDMGGESHLFNFYPHEGTALEDWDTCEAGHWRRVQLATYLIDHEILTVEDIQFEGGRIAGFALSDERLDEVIASGRPFMTTGCASAQRECACNRPAGDSGPTDIRSFPFAPNQDDMRMIRDQLWSRGAWDGSPPTEPDEDTFGVRTPEEASE